MAIAHRPFSRRRRDLSRLHASLSWKFMMIWRCAILRVRSTSPRAGVSGWRSRNRASSRGASVEDNVRLAAPQVSDAEVATLFEALGLSEHRTHFPGELSVGLARRAALARAFAVRPTLLLLDEPFVSLDAPLARQLQRDLVRLVESRSMITVLVTHDVDEAIALADRIFVLSARPAHVAGEIRVASPRVAVSGEEGQGVAAQIEALRGPNPPALNRPAPSP
jgi:ABC-type sugar transport system ATPase subunit